MEFEYKTSNGTDVILNINTLTDIVAVANNKKLICYIEKGLNFNPKSKKFAFTTDLKIGEQKVYLEMTDEVKDYIDELKEEKRLSGLPLKIQLQARINELEKETSFTYFVDADLVTGKKYFALRKRYDKNIWNKISKYFEYIDTSYHSDNFDAMYDSEYKGWLTDNPDEVNALLKDILNIDNTKEIETLKKELEEIEYKEKNDIEYRANLYKKSIETLKKKYPDFSEAIEELSKKRLIKKNSIAEIIDTLLEEEGFREFIYDPEKLPKIVSNIYSDGYQYLSKDDENGVAVVVTEKHIVVAHKPKYAKEWWNNPNGEMINGYFALFGACYIRVYKRPEKVWDIIRFLKELGCSHKKYYEDSKYFLIEKGQYIGDLYNIVTMSNDYNWSDSNYPKLENITRVGKFLDIDEM